jgi:hypothetical protein
MFFKKSKNNLNSGHIPKTDFAFWQNFTPKKNDGLNHTHIGKILKQRMVDEIFHFVSIPCIPKGSPLRAL